jgi:hypothetical protein
MGAEMKPNGLTAVLMALSLALMLALLAAAGATLVALSIVGFGAGLSFAACLLADSKSNRSNRGR